MQKHGLRIKAKRSSYSAGNNVIGASFRLERTSENAEPTTFKPPIPFGQPSKTRSIPLRGTPHSWRGFQRLKSSLSAIKQEKLRKDDMALALPEKATTWNAPFGRSSDSRARRTLHASASYSLVFSAVLTANDTDQLSFPVTAAGPFRIFTGFPILPLTTSERTPTCKLTYIPVYAELSSKISNLAKYFERDVR